MCRVLTVYLASDGEGRPNPQQEGAQDVAGPGKNVWSSWCTWRLVVRGDRIRSRKSGGGRVRGIMCGVLGVPGV
jgi:hypothetical protein